MPGKFAELITPHQFKSMPWKNGQGITKEIAIHPTGSSVEASNFLWRLSSAEIREAYNFSSFPGYDRLLTVIGEGELVLHVNNGEELVSLKSGEIFLFSGEASVRSEIPRGPVFDLGLIFQRDKIQAKMNTLPFRGKPRSFELTSPEVFFLVLEGNFQAEVYPGELKFSLKVGELLRICEAPGKAQRLVLLEPQEKSSRLVAVEIG